LCAPGEKSVQRFAGYQRNLSAHLSARRRPSAAGSNEWIVSKKAWSRMATSRMAMIRGSAAVVLAAMTPATMATDAHSFDDRVVTATSHQVVTFGAADEGSMTHEPDPTGDGFIIIECVVFDGRAVPHPAEPTSSPKRRLASVPRHPLGPSKCRPRDT
jgi:hypothetical protein